MLPYQCLWYWASVKHTVLILLALSIHVKALDKKLGAKKNNNGQAVIMKEDFFCLKMLVDEWREETSYQ